jgi:Plasmid maintenance system antidote protein
MIMEEYQDRSIANNKNKRKLCDQTLRIMKIMEEENMNSTQFSEEIGIQRAAMSHLINARNKPSADVITRILERFDTINPRWLLSGKGNMKINTGDGGMTGSSYVSNNNKNVYENSKDLNRFDSATEPDLFSKLNSLQTSSSVYSSPPPPPEANKRPDKRIIEEISERNEVNIKDNSSKAIEKEVVIYKERPAKTISKLLIFYTDNTYETFIPE